MEMHRSCCASMKVRRGVDLQKGAELRFAAFLLSETAVSAIALLVVFLITPAG